MRESALSDLGLTGKQLIGASVCFARSWMFHNTDLVVSICICGVVLTIIGLILVWWWLKRKHSKAMAAKEAAEAAEAGQADGAGSNISVFKGECRGSDAWRPDGTMLTRSPALP